MFNKSLIKKGEVIAVALSGGKDSVCLLHNLLSLSQELNITVKAVHVEHGIRGEESKNDAEFCKNLCKKLCVPLHLESVDAITFSKHNGYTLEQGARILRYEVFAKLITSNFADKIATAHHKNDSFETLLFNLFRGSGIKGARGILEENNNIIRPMLNFSRQDIDLYVQNFNLSYVNDSTNLNSDYSRNYIRNVIVPEIVKKFPDAINAGARFSQIAREEDLFLDNLSKTLITQKNNKLYIPLTAEDVLLSRAIILALNKLGLDKDYEYVHVLQIKNLLNLQSGALVTLPKGILAKREYDNVVIYKQENKLEVCFPFAKSTFKVENFTISISTEEGGLVFDGDKIPETAVIRTRKDGDVFTKFGGGTKKLKEYLIDKKIPALDRDKLLLVADGNVVYLIFGVEISDSIKITKYTTNKLYANIKAD